MIVRIKNFLTYDSLFEYAADGDSSETNKFQPKTLSYMFLGMDKLITELEKKGIKFQKLHALEVFGRGGDWHTIAYADKVNSLEVWEIDKKWKNELKKNLPHAKIRFLDSIQTIHESDNFAKFNFIVIDNPQNLYGPKSGGLEPQYCEHFDIIKKIDKLIGKSGTVVFNVNPKPFDYDKFPLWKKRREEFYGMENTSDMTNEFLINFYEKLFESLGFETVLHIIVRRVTPNPIETLYYFAYNLKRIEK